jgi:hypothetical protein
MILLTFVMYQADTSSIHISVKTYYGHILASLHMLGHTPQADTAE